MFLSGVFPPVRLLILNCQLSGINSTNETLLFARFSIICAILALLSLCSFICYSESMCDCHMYLLTYLLTYLSSVYICLCVTISQYTACIQRISISKLGTNIHYVSGHCRKGFQRSEIKGQGHSERNQMCFSRHQFIVIVYGRPSVVRAAEACR